MRFFPAPEYSVWCKANSTLYGPGGVEYVVDCCDHFDFCNRNLTPSFPPRGGLYSRLPRTRYNFLATSASFQGRYRENDSRRFCEICSPRFSSTKNLLSFNRGLEKSHLCSFCADSYSNLEILRAAIYNFWRFVWEILCWFLLFSKHEKLSLFSFYLR